MSDSYTTLVDSQILAAHLDDPAWRIMDCRFDLFKPAAGLADYQAGHIPGALYADLDRDLAGPVTSCTGRHPLPDEADFIRTLESWGIRPDTQVVVHDGLNGALAVRLWWMLRWVGHKRVALLDGGFKTWQDEGRPQEVTVITYPVSQYSANVNDSLWLSVEEVEQGLKNNQIVIIDARDEGRYSGKDDDPFDKVAGHIPNAHNIPFMGNLDSNGKFLTPERLRQRFLQTVTNNPKKLLVHSCGSGITACHNILAMEIAGLGGNLLYPGSWSEWITDQSRQVISEKGA